jgi:phosphatidylglycerol:prolipoprotein diacylglycerol transferase
VNGRPNSAVLLVFGPAGLLDEAVGQARDLGVAVRRDPEEHGGRVRMEVTDGAALKTIRAQLPPVLHVIETDVFRDLVSPNGWQKGDQALTLDVVRPDGSKATLGPFVPRTLGLHPTQVYETVSMLLLMLFLLAFHPFRHHDGQTMTMFLGCYAIHRFLNEILRNDTSVVGFNMSLSQNISILILAFAICLEIGLRIKYAREARAKPPAAAVA